MAQNRGQCGFCRLCCLGQGFHQIRNLGIYLPHASLNFAGSGKPLHRQALIGFNFAQPLNDTAQTPFTCILIRKDCDALVACFINAEIGRDNRAVVQHAADSNAFRHEPI